MPLRTHTRWFGVALDALDGPALAHFSQRLLGWTIFTETPEWTTLAPSEDAGYNLAFASEPNYVPPVWPSQPGSPQMMAHLDFEVDELTSAVDHALACGAVLVDFQPQDDVRVLLDTAGHPFCLYVDGSACAS